jgi:predicted CoA-binding protein
LPVPFENPSQEAIRELLVRCRTLAVIGLSEDPDRPSYSVASYMQAHGYRIVPVRPGGGKVLGERAYDRLADIPHPIDLVNVFRARRFVGGHVAEAMALGKPALWLQEGVIDAAAAERARAAGIVVVMDRCILKEHRRVGLGPRLSGEARPTSREMAIRLE